MPENLLRWFYTNFHPWIIQVLESFSCKNEVSKGESPNRCNVINPEKNENDVEKAFNEDCDHAADEWNNPPEKEESPLKIEQHGAVSKKHGECNKNEADNMLHCQRMQKKLGLFSPDEMNYTLPEDRNKTVVNFFSVDALILSLRNFFHLCRFSLIFFIYFF